MERGMRVYAKISSIIFSVLLILAIVFILLVRYSNCIGYKMCTSDFVIYGPIHWVIACLVLIVGVIVLIPLFYYGWNKEPKSNRIKILTKIITILAPVLIIIHLLTSKQNALYFWGEPILIIIFLIPLYSFGWKKYS